MRRDRQTLRAAGCVDRRVEVRSDNCGFEQGLAINLENQEHAGLPMPRQRPSLLSTFLARLNKTNPPKREKPAVLPFQAIAIYRGITACEMARKFSEHRFLAREAPSLPLQGCTMSQQCECRYLKFKDRRVEARRLDDFGAATRLYNGSERRGFRGRRKAD
jgi:hypothetical protein